MIPIRNVCVWDIEYMSLSHSTRFEIIGFNLISSSSSSWLNKMTQFDCIISYWNTYVWLEYVAIEQWNYIRLLFMLHKHHSIYYLHLFTLNSAIMQLHMRTQTRSINCLMYVYRENSLHLRLCLIRIVQWRHELIRIGGRTLKTNQLGYKTEEWFARRCSNICIVILCIVNKKCKTFWISTQFFIWN